MCPANRGRENLRWIFCMVKQLVPDELWMIIEPLLPPEPPKPNGGRPRAPDRVALAGMVDPRLYGTPKQPTQPSSS
jgi:hypothetical protein